jgi:translocation and assembly module TamB
LVLGGEWKLDAAPRLNGTLSVRRQRGDLYASAAGGKEAAGARGASAENGAGVSPSAGEVALGISTLELKATAADDAIDATLDARATRFGTVRGTLTIGRSGDGAVGRIDGRAPLAGSLVAELASLQPLQPFIGTAVRVDGRLDANLQLAGTLREAEVTGTLNGAGLKLDAPEYGLHWGEGVLRARLDTQRLTLEEFSFSAGEGRFRASGVVAAAGRNAGAGETPVGAGTEISWRADRLRATNRPDLRLVVSGSGKLAFADRHLAVSGALKVDEGRVDVEDRSGSALGPDVVIVGRPRPPPASAKRFGAIPFGVDLEVDLGPNLTVTGEGLETRAAGKVRVSATPDSVLTAKGTIRAVKGSYFAFGQRLSIERGRLTFDGPIDNPALDIVALRKHLQVEAGVKVTGTVKVPRVELTSEPPVPEGEKLSWLVLGQGLNQATSGADTAALQAAAATLFGGGRVPLGTTLARQIGLDDISVRGSSSMAAVDSTAGGANNQVVAVGKRLSDKLYVVFEQGLSVANNALKIEYALTRRITLRAEAGLISGVGIYYRRSFN